MGLESIADKMLLKLYEKQRIDKTNEETEIYDLKRSIDLLESNGTTINHDYILKRINLYIKQYENFDSTTTNDSILRERAIKKVIDELKQMLNELLVNYKKKYNREYEVGDGRGKKLGTEKKKLIDPKKLTEGKEVIIEPVGDITLKVGGLTIGIIIKEGTNFYISGATKRLIPKGSPLGINYGRDDVGWPENTSKEAKKKVSRRGDDKAGQINIKFFDAMNDRIVITSKGKNPTEVEGYTKDNIIYNIIL
jgi:hypothetical protein